MIRLLSVMRPSRRRAVWVGAARSAHPAGGVEEVGVLIDATVHLHLEQRLAQCLLSRFRAQGAAECAHPRCNLTLPDAAAQLPATGAATAATGSKLANCVASSRRSPPRCRQGTDPGHDGADRHVVVPSRTIACSGPASPTCSATARGTLFMSSRPRPWSPSGSPCQTPSAMLGASDPDSHQ